MRGGYMDIEWNFFIYVWHVRWILGNVLFFDLY